MTTDNKATFACMREFAALTESVQALAASVAKTERLAARQRKALQEELDWLFLFSRELTQSITAAATVEGQEARS